MAGRSGGLASTEGKTESMFNTLLKEIQKDPEGFKALLKEVMCRVDEVPELEKRVLEHVRMLKDIDFYIKLKEKSMCIPPVARGGD